MIGFRNWWQRDEPNDAAFEAGVRRLLDDPNTEFLLGGDPAAGVCQLRYRFAVWTGSEDCCLEDLFVEEQARGSGLGRALAEAALALLRVARLRELVRPTRGPEPAHAAASLISSTSSPTAMRPG
jgi:GNAT superfamily N-acetyltransferase